MNAVICDFYISAVGYNHKHLNSRTVEFAAEFGPSPALRPQSFDMSWIEYCNLDIIAIFVVLAQIFVYLSVKVTLFIARKVVFVKVKQD